MISGGLLLLCPQFIFNLFACSFDLVDFFFHFVPARSEVQIIIFNKSIDSLCFRLVLCFWITNHPKVIKFLFSKLIKAFTYMPICFLDQYFFKFSSLFELKILHPSNRKSSTIVSKDWAHHHLSALLFPQLLKVFLYPAFYSTHSLKSLSIVLDVVLLDSVGTLENDKFLSFLVDDARFSKLNICWVSNSTNINTTFVETGSDIVGLFLLDLEFAFIINVVINLNVLWSLDINSVWTIIVVNFLPVLLVHNGRLEAHLFLSSIILDSKMAHQLMTSRVLIKVEGNSFLQPIKLFAFISDVLVYQLD